MLNNDNLAVIIQITVYRDYSNKLTNDVLLNLHERYNVYKYFAYSTHVWDIDTDKISSRFGWPGYGGMSRVKKKRKIEQKLYFIYFIQKHPGMRLVRTAVRTSHALSK